LDVLDRKLPKLWCGSWSCRTFRLPALPALLLFGATVLVLASFQRRAKLIWKNSSRQPSITALLDHVLSNPQTPARPRANVLLLKIRCRLSDSFAFI
jgi:hypothetical protein